MLLLMPCAARADDRAFQWLRIDPPSEEDTLDSVQDVNNAGHILAKVKVGGTATRAAVYRDNAWHILEVSTNHTTHGTDINNDGTVVGYSGSNSSLKARIWYYNVQNETYDVGEDLGDDTEIWSINDDDELAGFDHGNGYPVGWFAEQTGWTQLNPLSGGDATAALGINGDGPPATIVGLSTEQLNQDPMLAWAVAWPGTTTPVKIDPGQIDESDTPYIINDNDWIVGSRGTTPSFTYILWRPDGQGWDDVETLGITGGSAKAVGLNNSNEIVAKKTLFYEDANLDLQDLSLLTLSGIPTSTGPLGHFYSSNMAYYAINDAGWIVGSAKYYDANEQDQGNVVILLVPFDRDNDGDPDYREIIADPSLDNDQTTGGNWVLDTATEMRVGLYAIDVGAGTSELVQHVDGITAVRLHGRHDLVHAILTNPTACTNFRAMLSYLGGHDDPDHQGKEIILMIRTPWPSDESLDYIPDAQTQAAMLADLRCFVSKYAYDIDAIQFGNEIFGGPGEYYVDLGGGCADKISDLDATCFPLGCVAVMEWMQKQVDAARDASALAGRPLQFITPAVLRSDVITGYDGNVAGPFDRHANAENRDAYKVQCVVEFGNLNAAPVDVHLHYRDLEQRAQVFDAIDYLYEDNAGQQTNIWDPAIAVTALEWSPVPHNTWLTTKEPTETETHGEILQAYFNSTPEPDLTWEEYIDSNWANAVFNGADIADLIRDDLQAFDGLLRHACYGEYQQGSRNNLANWDVTVVRAQHVHSPDNPWMEQEGNTYNFERLTHAAKGLILYAPEYIPHDNFDPHPKQPYSDSCGCD